MWFEFFFKEEKKFKSPVQATYYSSLHVTTLTFFMSIFFPIIFSKIINSIKFFHILNTVPLTAFLSSASGSSGWNVPPVVLSDVPLSRFVWIYHFPTLSKTFRNFFQLPHNDGHKLSKSCKSLMLKTVF